MDNLFKCRASAIGKLMTEPKTKKGKESGELSQTAKNYLQLWAKEKLYSMKKEVSSKYLEKGILCEDDSISLVSDYLGYFSLEKNGERREDGFFSGECDIDAGDCIIDVKNSFGFDTFPVYDTAIPNKDYYGQGQAYMSLWDKPKYKLIYTLNDLPDHMIESEFNKFCHAQGIERTMDVYEYIKAKHTYSHLPDELRIKIFEFDRCEDYIKTAQSKVLKAREYIKTLTIKTTIKL